MPTAVQSATVALALVGLRLQHGFGALAALQHVFGRSVQGALIMPRKPNYDFERREREKAKVAKKEERAKAKAARKDEDVASDSPPSPPAESADQ